MVFVVHLAVIKISTNEQLLITGYRNPQKMLTRIKTDAYFVLVASYSSPVRKAEDTGAYGSS